MGRRISQREAHRMKKQIAALEDRYRRLVRSWLHRPAGVHLGNLPNETMTDRVKLCYRLDHAVVVTTENNELQFYAVKT